MANQVTGWRRIYNAAGYSWKGFCAAWQHEAAFRQETVLALVGTLIAILLPVGLLAKLLLIGSMVLVIVVELLNSAIEAVVDRFGGEWHTLSGQAKDMGSAAVLLSLLWSLAVWIAVLIESWHHYFS
ncbi:diacylglycerol kinase [Rosenbergiella australiborealis]|uniref:Diacylglycerol kinase n=1 Tax=Rosenbergiella australiborealis TaxID=1544696 RepID=A0ABS5T4F5_9GAMM|nr:diacylglycerol kinase [Rosenbergiella australiborealis]MBT0727234.1 diacylglycerol kinase [Rosenbergiella australiborealis]